MKRNKYHFHNPMKLFINYFTRCHRWQIGWEPHIGEVGTKYPAEQDGMGIKYPENDNA